MNFHKIGGRICKHLQNNIPTRTSDIFWEFNNAQVFWEFNNAQPERVATGNMIPRVQM